MPIHYETLFCILYLISLFLVVLFIVCLGFSKEEDEIIFMKRILKTAAFSFVGLLILNILLFGVGC
jgi:hypothetical protein